MKFRTFLLAVTALLWIALFQNASLAHAESTISCPSGEYDMLDWMTMDSGLRSSEYLTGSSNSIYTSIWPGKFWWTKSGLGYPWDIQLYDNNYIYLWITELDWNNPQTFKKFANNTNMPLAPRCAKGGFPGSTIIVPDTSYQTYTDCTHYTTQNLKTGVNQVWGPYTLSFGGDIPNNIKTLVVSYRYNCDSNYRNCGDKEEYYLTQRYGLVQWTHYRLINGSYQQQQKSVFNAIRKGVANPVFTCF
jgi:hypothetical protein